MDPETQTPTPEADPQVTPVVPPESPAEVAPVASVTPDDGTSTGEAPAEVEETPEPETEPEEVPASEPEETMLTASPLIFSAPVFSQGTAGMVATTPFRNQ